jgi:capsular polysaccharide biosynthesis protein
MAVGIAAGLALGLILALLTEAADRRVRFPIDLEYSVPAPFLGSIGNAGRAKGRIGASRRSLRPV